MFSEFGLVEIGAVFIPSIAITFGFK